MQPAHPAGTLPSYDLPMDRPGKLPFLRVEVYDELTFRQQQIFLSPHRKNYYLLVYLKKGSGRHWVDMVPYDLKPNTFYFTTPEQVHLKEEATLSGVGISFSAELLTRQANAPMRQLPLIQNSQNAHELLLTPADQTELESLLDNLVSETNHQASWQPELLEAYLHVLLIRLSRIYQQQYAPEEPFTGRDFYHRFIGCLEENYRTTHQVSVYARLLNSSMSHFKTLIKTQSGKTALTLIHERLLVEAKRRLFHTDQSVKEIAFALGFNDDSYFNRFFRRMTGQTPAAYRTDTGRMYR